MRSVKDYLNNAITDGVSLLSLVLEKNHTWLIANNDYLLNNKEKDTLDKLIKQRENGVPFAYLAGTKGFYHLDFKVTPDTLIPRPETELLIDIALDLFKDKPCNLLDLGTGSGVIAITLADKNPQWKVSATDFSAAALVVAKQNATVEIYFQQGDWFKSVPNQTFDLIISNPPYIEESDPYLEDLKYEPITALTAGKDGLDDIRIIIEQAPNYLNNQGYLLLEHGYNQRQKIVELLSENFTHIQTFQDYNLKNRAILAQLQ
ncbi:Protein-N(5)-glutamine methyltransferase PrmC, methylates polypeptide chain release factors RF1 and RF2 [uncultured Candidatus Thioglobus sp.]|nr:Protein-N(5)-glutamine methyltransferase PrmC, methylates polypeptide chain release factors RF1 and RF2 [uncultured Candidatus Thioglobus sp.]